MLEVTSIDPLKSHYRLAKLTIVAELEGRKPRAALEESENPFSWTIVIVRRLTLAQEEAGAADKA